MKGSIISQTYQMLEKAHDFEGLERDAALTTVVLQGAEITSEFESRIEEIVSNLPISLVFSGFQMLGSFVAHEYHGKHCDFRRLQPRDIDRAFEILVDLVNDSSTLRRYTEWRG